MKDSVRRLILFIAIVGLGSVLIFVNLPLIVMLPLVVVTGFVLLLVLGAVTFAEIKAAFANISLKKLRKGSSNKPESPVAGRGAKPAAPKEPAAKKPAKAAEVKIQEKGGGIKGHLVLLASSIHSLKHILTDRKKQSKKPEEINKLLDRTISEKVTKSSLSDNAASVPASGTGGGGGALPGGNADETDPFLSLSGDDLDADLLNGLDDTDLDTSSAAGLGGGADLALAGGPGDDSDLSMPDLDMPSEPDSDANAEADAILKAHADPGANDLENLDGGDAIDASMGDLDNINLDDIDLGDDSPADPAPSSAPAAAPAPTSADLIPATPLTPAAEPDNDQSDISSFAAGGSPGSDEDMLSSLASDIKQVKKEKNVSLLRELKDFKAPATDIEQELQDMAGFLDGAGKGKKKEPPAPQGIK
ncbi:hypothetical protein [Methanoregula sp. UBA64]|jgi:hypothetical protein|uniref:hypothetical protein n=1 Tax=Methanoregula sp. UBA64 TaxID=1915554 RepID=UPI0025DBF8BD|nr:hypothetical protein [Methanoregula sp. UBA64]